MTRRFARAPLVRRWPFLLVSFVEGGALMAVELLGAKAVAPFYGSSLYVWSVVLAATVAGLTIGYALGGRLSAGQRTRATLYRVLVAGSILVALLPGLASTVMAATLGFEPRLGIALSCAVFLVPPLVTFGMVSPLVIRLVSTELEAVGRAAGTVYAVSTAGGVLATFAFGFYAIPWIGIRASAWLTAAGLASLTALSLVDGGGDEGASAAKRSDAASDPGVSRGAYGRGSPVVLSSRALLSIAYLEGVAVMATELLVAKMLAPLYGDSLYVWATVLGTTLAALAIGYFLGGVLVDRAPRAEVLLAIVLGAAAALSTLPALLDVLTLSWIDSDIVVGTIVCATLGLAPPLVLLGMVPSFAIRLLAPAAEQSGETSGRVYATSSLGGISAALVLGLAVIPALGLTRPALVTSALLASLPSIVLLRARRWWAALYLPVLAATVLAWSARADRGTALVKHFSEGLLGQVLVVDQPLPGGDPDHLYRVLYLNRMAQSVMDLETGRAILAGYVDHVMALAATRPEGARVLLLGLGGGSLVRELLELSFRVDAVELDERVIHAARQHFLAGVPEDRVRYVADDARHVIRTSGDEYDLIVFDVFRGERLPAHVFTRESLEDVRRILAPGGLLVLNLVGTIDGERGDGVRAVLATLDAAGLWAQVIELADAGNVLIAAGRERIDLAAQRNPLWTRSLERPVGALLRTLPPERLATSPVLTDDRPLLDVISLAATEHVRRGYTQSLTREAVARELPLFR